jgi:hypothetical protein
MCCRHGAWRRRRRRRTSRRRRRRRAQTLAQSQSLAASSFAQSLARPPQPLAQPVQRSQQKASGGDVVSL